MPGQHRRLRILHVVDSLDPGGMENGIINVARALDPAEFDVHCACLSFRGAFAARLPEPGQAVSLDKRAGVDPGAVRRLWAHIGRVRPDVLHSHNLGPLLYSVPAAAWGLRVPVFHGEHGQLDRHNTSASRLRQRRWFYRGCRLVHTVSSSLRADLIQHGLPGGKIIAIRNGVDTSRFCPAPDRRSAREAAGLGAFPEALVFGMSGRFSEFKGHVMLIDAFDSLVSDGLDAVLLLIGDKGSEKERVLARIESSPHRPRIRWAGHQERPEEFYKAMDLMVFPSSHEGLSNAVLESMACGLPVLGNTACGNAEVISSGEDGFLAPVDTTEALAAELRRLLSQPEQLARAGAAARAKAVAQLSLDAMVVGYREAYRAVARL